MDGRRPKSAKTYFDKRYLVQIKRVDVLAWCVCARAYVSGIHTNWRERHGNFGGRQIYVKFDMRIAYLSIIFFYQIISIYYTVYNAAGHKWSRVEIEFYKFIVDHTHAYNPFID